MKKFIVLIIVLAMFLTACNNLITNNEVSSYISGVSGSVNADNSLSDEQEMLEKSNIENKIIGMVSDKSNSRLISKKYSEQQIFEIGFLSRPFNPSLSFNYYMYWLETQYNLQIECVRKVDDKNYYCLFKTKEKGFVYCFFSDHFSSLPINNSVYLKQTLTKSDFSNLKLGDSIESVTEIDSAFKAYYDYNLSKHPITTYKHLLKDGVLVIEYEENIIKNIDFYDDFLVPIYGDFYVPGESNTYTYKILEQDYPQ